MKEETAEIDLSLFDSAKGRSECWMLEAAHLAPLPFRRQRQQFFQRERFPRKIRALEMDRILTCGELSGLKNSALPKAHQIPVPGIIDADVDEDA